MECPPAHGSSLPRAGWSPPILEEVILQEAKQERGTQLWSTLLVQKTAEAGPHRWAEGSASTPASPGEPSPRPSRLACRCMRLLSAEIDATSDPQGAQLSTVLLQTQTTNKHTTGTFHDLPGGFPEPTDGSGPCLPAHAGKSEAKVADAPPRPQGLSLLPPHRGPQQGPSLSCSAHNAELRPGRQTPPSQRSLVGSQDPVPLVCKQPVTPRDTPSVPGSPVVFPSSQGLALTRPCPPSQPPAQPPILTPLSGTPHPQMSSSSCPRMLRRTSATFVNTVPALAHFLAEPAREEGVPTCPY